MLLTSGLLLALILSCARAVCVPGLVSNITYLANNTLQWSKPSNPYNCTITSYVIDVLDEHDGTLYQFQSNSSVLSYTFNHVLGRCKSYIFEVHALTDEYVLGPSDFYNTTIPPGENADFTLSPLTVTRNTTTSEVILRWNLTIPETATCVTYYRVVYWDEDTTPLEQYVEATNFTLKQHIPCSNYTVRVSAIVGEPDNEGPPSEAEIETPSKAPSTPNLVSLVKTNSSVTMVWSLEPYAQNHCVATFLNGYTSGVAANISYIHEPIPFEVNVPQEYANFTISGLEPGSMYTTNVNVENGAGTSPNVTVIYSVEN